jgi:hypothetical protein
MALAAEAGDTPQASTFAFPAATTTWTPAATAFSTASLIGLETRDVPRLMVMTAPFGRFWLTTQSIASIIPRPDPDPFLSKHLTEIKLAFLAIPYFLAPTVPKIEME